jgi:single-stranded-DNA-specific exonuclease
MRESGTMRPARETIVVRRPDDAAAADLSAALGVSTVVARILTARGLHTFDECKRFFRPDSSQFHDPFLFGDMEKACDRIFSAIRDRETIIVYGDYDVDGVTATAMLIRILRQFGAVCDYYLPNRLTEGYGLSAEGIRAIGARGAKLVITVDCGITACDEVALAASCGIDVIVTDHHEPKDAVPGAYAVLNPKLSSCEYPDKSLAGVGVALKLCQGLVRRMGGDADQWSAFLDLAALGTAADIVPLQGENRVIVSLGFGMLAHTRNPGLSALLSVQDCGGKDLSTGDVVFRIAPCINATGRLGDSRRGVELLLTDNKPMAMLIAQELRQANVERRALDSKIQEEAFAWVDEHCDPDRDFAIVAGSETWHCGVVGIVASKIVEKYHRPAILFAIGDNGMARGSGRSIPGFHLHEALTGCSTLLEGFGGHAAAAGMTLKRENLDKFRHSFNDAARAKISTEDLVPRITADTEVKMSDLTPKLYSILKQMEPFGPGNMRPVLVCRDLRNKCSPKIVGKNHLKLSVHDGNGAAMDAVAFNFGDRLEELITAQTFTLAFSLDENEWNGRTTLQLKIRGVET